MKKTISLFTILALFFSLSTSAAALTINSFAVYSNHNGENFDPSPQGENDNLILSYNLSSSADVVSIEIRDIHNKLVKTFSAGSLEKSSGIFLWDGEFEDELVEPGMYTATLIAKKSGESEITAKKIFYVAYNDSSKPEISDFELSTDAYNPNSGDNVTISFTNEEDSDLTVEVRDQEGKTVMTFGSYDGDNYDAGEDHKISWNGKGEFLTALKPGNYDVYAIARNNFGVVSEKETININYSDSNSSDNSGSTGNAHIEDLTVTPFKFEPNGDKELKIKFDIKKDLDELQIIAVHGSTQIEIFEEDDVEEQDNFEATWDGDEAVSGDFQIQVKTEVGSTNLTATRSFQINFEKPDIEDLILSKSKFDNEAGEFTNILFRLDREAEVEVVILEDNKEEDSLVEDLEVEDSKWYSVQWDGDDFDYEDDLEIKLIVKNEDNEKIFNTKKIKVDLAEDEVSSKKTNVTNDYIEPAIGASGEEMTLHYELDDDADVTVTIYKGSTASGSKIIELVDDDDQDEGEHSIEWDGRDDDDDKLSKGVYSYKIVAEKGAYEEVESGIFVIGAVGEIDNNDTTKKTKKSGKISKNVISIDGGVKMNSECGGFADVSANSKYCDAIEWAYDEGIFVGYGDGTFKPFQSISRSEALKVILEALEIEIDSGSYSPFNDVAKNSWYSDYVFTAKQLGIFHGDKLTGKARPEATVNRAELLKFIFESLEASSNFKIGSCGESYNDVSKSNWYFEYACEAEGYDLFEGNYLSPGTLSSRGETAYLLYKLSRKGLL